MTTDKSDGLSQLSPPAPDVTPKSMTAEETRAELTEAIKGSNQVLMSADTVLTLFPDTLVVDRAKLSIIKRSFFRTAEIASMRIEDVLNVECTLGPFFGTVIVITRVVNSDQTLSIGRFWRDDARRLKRIIQGYVIALQRNIDCSALDSSELTGLLEKLGADTHPTG